MNLGISSLENYIIENELNMIFIFRVVAQREQSAEAQFSSEQDSRLVLYLK